MQAAIPKQYLELCGRPIAAHSFITFSGMPEVKEIVIVCGEDWRYPIHCSVTCGDSECSVSLLLNVTCQKMHCFADIFSKSRWAL